jgi:excisionase family DNA binding protein
MVEDKLLHCYLTLNPEKRLERFADTSRAAEITGLSRRTIQFWIEVGQIHAVRLGKKYQVDLHSLYDYLNRNGHR